MFDFSTINAKSDPIYSFVGIKDSQLCLPKGCEAWAKSLNEKSPVDKFTETQTVFLDLYRTLRVYRGARKELTGAHDSGQQAQGGQEILDENHKEGGQIIYYRHMDILDCILEVYDEQGILSLVQRIGRSERLDYSKIHKHLDRATFLEDDSFVVDEMMLPRQQLDFEPVEIVQMYCFALLEIKKLLNENDSVPADIRVLAEQFAECHLASGDSLFQFSTWEHTRNILRERLEIIDNNTHYKDDAYHDFYDALERFLWGSSQQGQQGEQWGISAFHPVWESMCLNYLIKFQPLSIVACDTGSLPETNKSKLHWLENKEGELWTIEALKDVFQVNSKKQVRCDFNSACEAFQMNSKELRPDCVLSKELSQKKYEEFLKNLYQVSELDGSCSSSPYSQKLCTVNKSRSQHSDANDLNFIDKEEELNSQIAFAIGFALKKTFDAMKPKEKKDTEYYKSWGKVKTPNSILDKCDEIFNLPSADKHKIVIYLNFVRGIIWNHFKSTETKLDLYTKAKDVVSKHKGMYLEINELNRLIQLHEQSAEVRLENTAEITIIDFKYLLADYMLAPKNIADIRDASVRKQFVYEYLLKEKLIELRPDMKLPSIEHRKAPISSEFWIPEFQETDDIKLKLKQDFLGGFIPLQPINVKALMVQYAET